MWPDSRLLDLLRLEYPIIEAPMAGAMDAELAAAVSAAGGLGSLPCAMLTAAQVREEVERIRSRTRKPINLNFFCHKPPRADEAREQGSGDFSPLWSGEAAALGQEMSARDLIVRLAAGALERMRHLSSIKHD